MRRCGRALATPLTPGPQSTQRRRSHKGHQKPFTKLTKADCAFAACAGSGPTDRQPVDESACMAGRPRVASDRNQQATKKATGLLLRPGATRGRVAAYRPGCGVHRHRFDFLRATSGAYSACRTGSLSSSDRTSTSSCTASAPRACIRSQCRRVMNAGDPVVHVLRELSGRRSRRTPAGRF